MDDQGVTCGVDWLRGTHCCVSDVEGEAEVAEEGEEGGERERRGVDNGEARGEEGEEVSVDDGREDSATEGDEEDDVASPIGTVDSLTTTSTTNVVTLRGF